MQGIIRSGLWLGYFAVILGAWAVLYAMSVGMGLDLLGRPGPGMSPPTVMPMARFAPLFAMWAVMMAAMMLPTLVPTLRSYEDLMTSANGTRAGWLGVLLGYFAVWVGFAAVIAALQLRLLSAGLVDGLGVATTRGLSVGLLLLVGLYQFSRAKAVCHGVCHAPTLYFLRHWRTGIDGGLRMGLGLGVYCAGCCWGFMALGFVGGVMSLAWMGLATLCMVIEKLPQVGRYVTRPIGAALVAGAVAMGAGVI
ncbi:DUF2182 domain-containing protein [Puniceibacterium confluentis]|uniref:DUF2182 domain-containing protein n=1 Tax=Puniceibacterium confluentis TaxID=1958944 RepID=UPI0011B55C6D|nr:DUF2182 domain-containing protein [Puniceibacterium confluentis]